MNIQQLNLDLSKKSGNQQVAVAQGDSAGTTIEATIYDNGTRLSETGVTAYFLMELPDRVHYVRSEAEYSDGVITYVADEEYVAAVDGYTDNAYFELHKDGDIVSTERFSVRIVPCAYDGKTPGESYDTEIEQALVEISLAVEDATAAAAEARAMIGAINAFGAVLVYDGAAGCYTNESVKAVLAAKRDGLAYGVSIPKGSATACTKIGANAGIPNPAPGTANRAAIDPYVQFGPFFHLDVNATVDADGTPHVTAVEGDGRFRKDGTNGDVWVLAPVLWWLYDESGEDACVLSISDTALSGLSPQPQAYLPNGALRPYMLYAKYIGSKGNDGYMHSYSGVKPWTRNVSHNTLITQCRNASTGYSGKNVGDDWYIKTMFTMKYATKNSQSVFMGCTVYNTQVSPSVAEIGVTRVIVSKTDASKLIVGSSMILGTHTGASIDRNTAYNYDVFDGVRIVRIEDYDASNSSVYMDIAAPFDTATTFLFSTFPWFSGALDVVEGDGTITDAGRTSGKEPFKLQGIECMGGSYEIIGNLILSNMGSGWEPCINPDSANEATSITSDYLHAGMHLPSGDSDGWHYPMYPVSSHGLMFGLIDGASSTTGLCDGQYANKTSTIGTREWLGVGALYSGGNAGLWCGGGGSSLTDCSWHLGSRLSGIGRGRAAG